MRLDFTITLPGLLEIKNMFDLSRELDVELLTKVMFTFSNDEILSPLSLPEKLLHEYIDDALDYIEPKATWKQRALIDVLKNLRNRKTFTPSTKGKIRQERIDVLRGKNILDHLQHDERLVDWWKSI